MDLNEYNKLREKIQKKDFEGKNKQLDRWLFNATFFANAISIFFAFFLLYPALQGSFLMNIGNEVFSNILAGVFSVGFLVIFEVVKRYLIRNFSFDYIWSGFKDVVTKTWLWFSLVVIIITTSFYLSMSGALNFADTFEETERIERVEFTQVENEIKIRYGNRINEHQSRIDELRSEITNIYSRISDLPQNFITERNREYQRIAVEEDRIESHRTRILELENQMAEEIKLSEKEFLGNLEEKRRGEHKNLFLFIIIVFFNESLIVLGLYFREYFEYVLYKTNSKTYESYFLKKRHYEKMIKFLYNGGYLGAGDKVKGLPDLENELMRKTKIENVPKFMGEFIGVLRKNGVIIERRGEDTKFGRDYEEALNIIKSFEENVIELEYEK